MIARDDRVDTARHGDGGDLQIRDIDTAAEPATLRRQPSIDESGGTIERQHAPCNDATEYGVQRKFKPFATAAWREQFDTETHLCLGDGRGAKVCDGNGIGPGQYSRIRHRTGQFREHVGVEKDHGGSVSPNSGPEKSGGSRPPRSRKLGGSSNPPSGAKIARIARPSVWSGATGSTASPSRSSNLASSSIECPRDAARALSRWCSSTSRFRITTVATNHSQPTASMLACRVVYAQFVRTLAAGSLGR